MSKKPKQYLVEARTVTEVKVPKRLRIQFIAPTYRDVQELYEVRGVQIEDMYQTTEPQPDKVERQDRGLGMDPHMPKVTVEARGMSNNHLRSFNLQDFAATLGANQEFRKWLRSIERPLSLTHATADEI